MWRDIRYSAQGLLRTPVFAATAVVILALGIGLNTALFSVVNSIFFKPPSVHAPRELAYLYWVNGTVNRRPFVMPAPDYEFFVTHNGAFEAVTAHWGVMSRLTVDGDTQVAWGENVRANYFDVLGVKPALGRALRLEEDGIATPDLAVVISHDLWTRRFHGSVDVIGKAVRIPAHRELAGAAHASRQNNQRELGWRVEAECASRSPPAQEWTR